MAFILQNRRTVLGIGGLETVSWLPIQNQHTLSELPTPPACAKLGLRMQTEQDFSQDVLYCLLGNQNNEQFFLWYFRCYAFGPGQNRGIAEKSIFQVLNLNILKPEGKKGELR